MRSLEPYLIFNGNCREAFTFYESVFDVKIAYMMRYGEMPGSDRKDMSEKDMERLVHVLLPVSKNVSLMGSDSPGDMPAKTGDNVALTINVESRQEAEHLYKKLSQGGKIMMPLGKTFFAELYAMFTDKFGVNWMILYMQEQKK